MFCTQCGQKIDDSCNFCTRCGAQLRDIPRPERSYVKAQNHVLNPPILKKTAQQIVYPSSDRSAPPLQVEQIQILLKQANESANLVNTTVKPDVFFGRIGFLLDVLLELQKYERYKVFTGSLPSDDYKKLLNNLEKTVDNFIDRAIWANKRKLDSLKTPAAKERNYSKFILSLSIAFGMANNFWQGNGMYPHYIGPLFTDANFSTVQSLLAEADAKK